MNGYPRFGWVDIIRFQQPIAKSQPNTCCSTASPHSPRRSWTEPPTSFRPSPPHSRTSPAPSAANRNPERQKTNPEPPQAPLPVAPLTATKPRRYLRGNALGIEAFRSRHQARFTIARRRSRNAPKFIIQVFLLTILLMPHWLYKISV